MPPDKVKEGSSPGEFVWIDTPQDGAFGFTGGVQGSRRALPSGGRRAPRLLRRYSRCRLPILPIAGVGTALRLLTTGNLRGGKGECILTLADLVADPPGSADDPHAGEEDGGSGRPSRPSPASPPASSWLGATMGGAARGPPSSLRLKDLADRHQVPLIAVNDVIYHDPSQRDLQDVLPASARVSPSRRRLPAGGHAERHLKPATRVVRLFRDCPEADPRRSTCSPAWTSRWQSSGTNIRTSPFHRMDGTGLAGEG